MWATILAAARVHRRAALFCLVIVVAAFASAAASVLAACSLDPSVGIRCDEHPTRCRPDAGSKPSNVDSGLPPPVDDAAPPADAGNSGSTVSFTRDIRPLIARAEDDPTGPGCSLCHYRSQGTQTGIQEAQFDMTTLGDIRRGGKTSGATIIVPGDPDASVLVQKLRGTYAIGSRMPWNGPPYWSDAEIQLVATWIAEGARGAEDE